MCDVGQQIINAPMMPWQRQVLDVAMELDADGRPAYRRVVLTVPRQSGKTTLQLALFVHRALAWGTPQVMAYAAQTGKDARNKLIDPPNGQIPMLQRSPFKSLFRPRFTNGHEAILWRNGSRHTVAANTEKSGHGDTLDLGLIDEAFSQVDARLEQAMSPAMATRPDSQLWIVSTAGTEQSSYFRAKVEAGRTNWGDTDGGTAYFEWSAEDDVDIDDPREWYRWMPALGLTTTESFIGAELTAMRSEGNEDEWRRAYGNQWRDKSSSLSNGMPGYESATTTRTPSAPFALGLEVSTDSRSAAISIVGGAVVEVVDYRKDTGITWAVPRVLELAGRYNARVGIRKGSPAEQLHKSIPGSVLVAAAELPAACMSFARDINEGDLWHRDQPVLDIAAAAAVRVTSGDVWRWSLTRSMELRGTDISPLLAATVARHLWATGSAPYDPLDSIF